MMFRRSLAVGLCGGCVALACIAYYIQEANAERNSPRQLIMGRVISVSEDRSRSGNISDQFQLQLGNAKLSPKFSTGAVATSASGQPVHQGDVLGVLYRTWDSVPLTIDEIEGKRQGWHYTRSDDGSAYIVSVALFGAVLMIGLFFVAGKQRREVVTPEDNSLRLNDL
jgi:hypothetical protein